MTELGPSGRLDSGERRTALSLEDLTAGLASVLSASPRELTVADREHNLYSTSSLSEIVTCRFGPDREEVFLVKREAGSRGRDYGYWGGIAYEAMVYREVLGPLGVQTPTFFGTFVDETGVVSSVFAFLEGALRVYQDPQQRALAGAARWIGQFHRLASKVNRSARRRLKRYDLAFYAGWAVRTLQLADREQHGWLVPLCANAPGALAALLDEPDVVIHGEFYPSNVLVSDQRIYPVDWETTAIAAGEIDLAALTDDWPDAAADECERAYASARWPGGPPSTFARTLDLSRLYLGLRWLGDRREWTMDDRAADRYERLRVVGDRLGLTDPRSAGVR